MKKRLIVFLLALTACFSVSSGATGIPGVTGIKAYCDDIQAADSTGGVDLSESSDSLDKSNVEDDSHVLDTSTKVSFSSIKSIMIENSIDMKIAQNTLDNSKQDVTKINDKIKDLGYSPSSISKSIDELDDEIDELEKSISNLDKTDENYEKNKASYENKKSEKEKTLSQLKQYKEQRKNASRNHKKAQLTYDKTVSNAVFKAQQSYVNYLSQIADIEQKKSNIELKKKEAETAKLKYDNGFISKKEYDNANTSLTDLNNELNEAYSKEEISLKNLKLSLGIDQGEDITLSDDLEADFNAVQSINFEDDLDEMLKNSVDLQTANMEIDWADEDEDEEEDNDNSDDHDYENYDLENKELKLDKNNTQSEINFKEQYNKLMNSYNSLKAGYDKVQTKQESYALLGKKYSFGFVSRNDLEQSKIDLDKQSAEFNNSRNQFYLDYLNYIQMKEGY